MKKIMLAFVTVVLLSAQVVHGQVFPVVVTVVWDPNPSTEQVTKYTVTHNSNTPIDVPPTACSATECQTKITLINATNTVSLTATNMWGTSQPVTLTFIAQSPGRSGNIRIRVP